MMRVVYDGDSARWLSKNCSEKPEPIAKATQATRAWFATIGGRAVFIKWYPEDLRENWARVDAAITGADLHPAIVSLRQRVDCADGTLLVYDRVRGLNLGPSDARSRFQKLPLAERITAVVTVAEALGAICDAGFMIVDWYFGNMIYGFDASRIWLFD